jgi:photosystem II stability/assembly factor-like uncharacterized protein
MYFVVGVCTGIIAEIQEIFNFPFPVQRRGLYLQVIKPINLKKFTFLLLLSALLQAANAQWHQRALTITQTHYFQPAFFIPHSIHFSSVNNGFIAGDDGIFRYNGKQWLPVPSGPEFTPYLNAVYTTDSSHTYFAGEQGEIYKYDGHTFTKLNSGTTNTLSSIYMIDSTDVWASGEGGTILHISGDSVKAYSIYPYEISHIYFDRKDHGWALTTNSYWIQDVQYYYGTVYEFKNNQWLQHSTLNGIMTDINFTPSGEGYISSSVNLFHFNKSLNSWQQVFPQNLAERINSVSMLNDSTGICMQADSSYLLCKNGKWTEHAAVLTNMLGVQYVDSATIWAISTYFEGNDYGNWKNHLIYQLSDTGWQAASLQYLDTIRTEAWKGDISNVTAFGKKDVRLDGFLINIPDTSDWIDTVKNPDPPLSSFLSGKSFNGTVAWGDDRQNLIRANGNKFTSYPLFNFDPFDSSNLIYGIHYFDDTTCWAVGMKYKSGGGGNQIPYIVYYDRAKNGITAAYNPPTTKTPFKVHFADKNNGWCVGDSGLILHYANNNWQMMDYPTDNFLGAVFTIDATDAWAGGTNGTLLKYDGKSWQRVNINTTKGIYDIYFTDKDHGWLVGEGGLMYKYDGTSWTKDTSITTNNLINIFMVNSNYGWAVGDAGTILQYINNDTAAIDLRVSEGIPSTIFPNPSSQNITIKFELKKAGNTWINLFNQQGNEVNSYNLGRLPEGKSAKSIDISNLQNGTYFYQIISSGEKGKGKFIKVQ